MHYPVISKMKTMLQLLAVVAAIVGLCGAATPIKKCNGEGAPSIKNVQVQLGDCTQWPCVLKRGGTYKVEVRFKAGMEADNLKSVPLGTASGNTYTVAPLIMSTDSDACQRVTKSNGQKGACPLQAGQSYIYTNSFAISQYERPLTFNEQWSLVDEDDETIACYQIPIKIE